ncbi:MAG TPA: hypothetical protein VFA82_05505, partial [Gaiellaceae bacterium]|nr:hypothetical protein [Gaiellaceae bacterium]
FQAGDARVGWEKYYELKPLRDLWTSIYEVLWVKEGALHPLATIKYWMELIGMSGGPVRPPLKPLSAEAKALFRARLDATGWVERLFDLAEG